MVILGPFFNCVQNWKMFELDNIRENGKPIALLFGEKWSFLHPFSIEFKIGKCLNWTIFGEMASL